MKLYVISDYFYELIKNPEIHYSKWEAYRPASLGGYRCVLIDVTYETDISRQVRKIETLVNLMNKLHEKDFLSNNDLILLVICGSPTENLEFEERYDINAEESGETVLKRFFTYDFVKQLMPVSKRIAYEEGKHIYPIIAPSLINTYLETYASGTTYLSYGYEAGKKEFADVTPLATIKENVNQCVAFECRTGRGLLVVLPAYKNEAFEKAFSLLAEICNSYIKRRETTYEGLKVGIAIPDSVKKSFIEAYTCFKNGLYDQSIMSCRKALEISAVNLGANPDKTLNAMIKDLCSKGIIDSRLNNLADLIRGFGNLGAHAPKYQDLEITEEDAINVIEFSKIFFDYVYVIPKRIQDSRQKIEEFKRREDS